MMYSKNYYLIAMMCLICHTESNNTVLYSCGHSYHTKCLLKWSEIPYANKTVNNFHMGTSCPYCRKDISLFRVTRIDRHWFSFRKELLWYLDVFSKNFNKFDGVINSIKCEMCSKLDMTIHMKINDENNPGKYNWVCRECQSRLWKDGECPYIGYQNNKNIIDFSFNMLKYIWKGRIMLRKNRELYKMFKVKAAEFKETFIKVSDIDSAKVGKKEYIKMCNLLINYL